MKRSDFLKKLGIGLGVAVVAPQVFAEKDNFSGDDVTLYTKPLPKVWYEPRTISSYITPSKEYLDSEVTWKEYPRRQITAEEYLRMMYKNHYIPLHTA